MAAKGRLGNKIVESSPGGRRGAGRASYVRTCLHLAKPKSRPLVVLANFCGHFRLTHGGCGSSGRGQIQRLQHAQVQFAKAIKTLHMLDATLCRDRPGLDDLLAEQRVFVAADAILH